MPNDFEALARALQIGSKSQKPGGVSLEKIGALLKTEDGRRLLTLLANGGADTIKSAAKSALRGDDAGAKIALLSLLGTKEGAALAKKLSESLIGTE